MLLPRPPQISLAELEAYLAWENHYLGNEPRHPEPQPRGGMPASSPYPFPVAGLGRGREENWWWLGVGWQGFWPPRWELEGSIGAPQISGEVLCVSGLLFTRCYLVLT